MEDTSSGTGPEDTEPGFEPHAPPVATLPATITLTGVGILRNEQPVVHDLSLMIMPGTVVAVSGPPGSGNDRVLLTLAGRVEPDEGAVRIIGKVGQMGWIPEIGLIDEYLTVLETMRECALAEGAEEPAVHEALQIVGLAEMGDVLCGCLTTPQRIRLGIGWGLLSRPAVLAIDATDSGPDEGLFPLAYTVATTGCVVLIGTAMPSPPADVVIHTDPYEVTP